MAQVRKHRLRSVSYTHLDVYKRQRERSDIDIAVSGVNDFDLLVEKIEDLPTLYSVDVLNMDTCRNELLMEDVRKYGRKIL